MIDGRHTGTGGGNHVVLGGATPADSPFLRRPDLLQKPGALLAAPSVAVLPVLGAVRRADQPGAAHRRGAPRRALRAGDRARADARRPASGQPFRRGWSIACSATCWPTSPATPTAPKSASTKLYSPDGPTGRLGLVEFRSFEMPPDARMSLAQQLLIRALVAWFWREPAGRAAGALGHDAARPLHAAAFRLGGFSGRARRPRTRRLRLRPGMVRGAARVPLSLLRRGRDTAASSSSCARRWSPGTCWARRPRAAARCASSTPRSSGCRSKPTGFVPGRHVVTCNGRRMPMTSTGESGEAVAGVRFKAWKPASGLHPTIPVHAPLTFDLVDTWNGPLARRLRLSRRPSRRAQLRDLPGEFLRSRGAPAGAIPGSRAYCRAR